MLLDGLVGKLFLRYFSSRAVAEGRGGYVYADIVSEYLLGLLLLGQSRSCSQLNLAFFA